MEITQYHTSIEQTDDVVETLKWKMEIAQADGLPVENTLADYIALGIDNLHSQLAQLKQLKEQIKERETELKEQDRRIKEGAASFLIENGLDRLDGTIISSVTIAPAKAPTTKKKFVRDCTAKEAEDLLEQAGLGHYEEVEVEGSPETVRINKRKG